MKAAMRKAGEVALSILLVGLICIPIPAMNAFAEETTDEATQQSEQAEPQADEADATTEASDDETQADDADDTEATEATEDEGVNEEDATTSTDGEAAVDTDDATATETTTKQIEGATAKAKAAATDTATVSNAKEFADAFEAANKYAGTGTYTIKLAADIDLATSATVSAGKDVTIDGNGHTITLEGSTVFGTKGRNAVLTLDGTLTIQAAGSRNTSAVTVNSGTLNMNSGVTITGNTSSGDGGGVSVARNATFNMNGGTIENCHAHQGGGVYLKAYAKFYMNGGTICNNGATNVGGGVYVSAGAEFTMAGNAAVVSNTANAAGGVMNYGTATLTTVYNNTTINGAADIYNYEDPNDPSITGTIKLGPTNPDWVLSSTGTHVTGWYVDNYAQTDEDGNQADGNHRWNPALNDNVPYVPTGDFTTGKVQVIAGAPLPEKTFNVTWENEDGTVLYTLNDVKESEVPAADEYTTLSGNENPTEPDTEDGYTHEFTGWISTQPTDDQVLYIANYKLIPPATTAHTLTIHYVDENGNKLAPDFTEAIETGDQYDVPSPHVDGYEADDDEVTGTAGDNDIDTTVVYHTQVNPNTNTSTDTDDGDTPVDNSTANENANRYGTPGENARTTESGTLQHTGDQMGYAIAGLAAVVGISVIALGAAIVIRKRDQID